MKPDFAKAYFNRGFALKQLKRYPQAKADLNRYLEMRGNNDGLESKVRYMISEINNDFTF